MERDEPLTYTVVNIPGLDISDPKKNIAVFKMHMNQEALQLEECYGKVLWWGLSYIKENYQFKETDLLFLVEGNPIIPEEPKSIIHLPPQIMSFLSESQLNQGLAGMQDQKITHLQRVD